MNKYFIVLLTGLLTVSCAPSLKRIGYQIDSEPLLQTNPQIIYDASGLDSTKKIGTLIIYDNGLCLKNTREDALETIIRECESIGARAANLYNMKEPSFFASSCFQTYADFYSDSIYDDNELPRKYLPTNYIDSTFNRGPSFSFCMLSGIVTGGNQKKPGLDPEPESVFKIGMGLRGTYMHTEALGFDVGCDILYTTAHMRGYEPFALYNERIIRSGIRYAWYRKYSPFMMTHLDIQSGINYDLLKLSDDLVSLIETASGGLFQPYPGYAKGWGWYAGLNMQMHMKSNFFGNLGIEYETLNPKFEPATTSIDANLLLFQITFGYRF
jgi:hypothetical protein